MTKTAERPPLVPHPVYSNEWLVASSRDAETQYTVVLHHEGDAMCDCPGYAFNGKCWHVETVTAAVQEQLETAVSGEKENDVSTEEKTYTTESWDAWSHEGQVAESLPPPEIAQGSYRLVIAEVGKPTTGPNFDGTAVETRFAIDFAVPDALPDGPTLRKRIRLTPGYRDSGVISPKSALYEMMTALGFDMTRPVPVEPWTWVGLECMGLIKPGEPKPGGGKSWPRIESVWTLGPKASPAAATAAPTKYGRAGFTLDQVLDGVKGGLTAAGKKPGEAILAYFGLEKGTSARVIKEKLAEALTAAPPDADVVAWLVKDILEGDEPFE